MTESNWSEQEILQLKKASESEGYRIQQTVTQA